MYAGDQRIDLPGVSVAVLDTAIPSSTTGRITGEQLEWLDDLRGRGRPTGDGDGPPSAVDRRRAPGRRRLLRPRSRRQRRARGGGRRGGRRSSPTPPATPTATACAASAAAASRSIEVGCVKDFPGTWAEYRVYEGGIMQVVHRISTPDALAWSERCRHLYRDFGIDYATYALGG